MAIGRGAFAPKNGLLIQAENTKDFRKLIKGKSFRHVFQFFHILKNLQPELD